MSYTVVYAYVKIMMF